MIVERNQAAEAATDTEIVMRVGRGDATALADLYDRHASTAYSLAVKLVGEARAEDVVQDAFVALLDRRLTFDPARGTFRAWFLTAVHHRCLNLLCRNPTEDIEAVAETLSDADPEPVDLVVQRLQGDAVRAALVQLPVAQREVLVLAYYGGLSQSMLARRLDVPLGTVKARMRRGLITLSGLLRGEAIEVDEDNVP